MNVFVDVDDTLVRSVGSTRIPMPLTIEKIRELKGSGHSLYLWSSGGAEYARKTAEELKIAECFDAFLPKPDVMIDDQPFEEWKSLRHQYP